MKNKSNNEINKEIFADVVIVLGTLSVLGGIIGLFLWKPILTLVAAAGIALTSEV